MRQRSFHELAGGALVLLDVSVVGFYALWFAADTAAVNRAEERGLDPQQLLVNSHWLWAFANATLVCLVALNVILIAGWRRHRKQENQEQPVQPDLLPIER